MKVLARSITLFTCLSASSHAVVITLAAGQTDFDFIAPQGLPVTFDVINPNTYLPTASGFDISLPIASGTPATFNTEAIGRQLLGDVLHSGGFTLSINFGLGSLDQAVSGLTLSQDPLLVDPAADLAITEAGIGITAFDVEITRIDSASIPDGIIIEGTLELSGELATALGFPLIAGANLGTFRTTGYAVPEPATSLLVGLGLLGITSRRRR